MKLHVFVCDKPVATLESVDGFRHVMSYHPEVEPRQFVSLLMPVRTESYVYPDLHPLFRMNLPEGFLLSVLQEQLGPQVGASPISLLSVVGRNAIGRVKVAAPGADPTQPPVPFELASILRGDNSEAAFIDLVRRHAVSGVSGVVPKFLSPATLAQHGKGTLATDRHIIKGTTSRLPGVALNEHLCMEVARRAGIPTAETEVSEDGQALVVHRFDFESDGVTRKGMEDLCSLLSLRPEEKYQSTWERVVGRIKDVVPDAAQQNAALSRLADLLLLTYALRNADCHTKNIALLYSSRESVTLAPVYDMLTITVYDDYARNPPGMSVEGRSSWMPGKALERFLQTRCGVMPAQARERAERICQAIVEVTPGVVEAAGRYPGFRETGKRMLHAWNDGMNSLRLQKTWSLPSLNLAIAEARFSDLKPMVPTPRVKIGRSPLLGKR
ncbi:MAG: type II toxin-antitoxin system HipA family toxin [Gammaproteobacteria bacterium]|nr:type II toxin-antitoxin system HipA family toxin [Gammaproteobacteria bacterium]MBU1441753.1 type II toxin-antitoxin system HipA family toxin [Gammaproteobacteria bacterium]MBU2288679.1 type II toxin-antitoxin system HipA family toxin [Gammaproteobacteria bacterium]MBU2408224.1 type II toxin-antitoxin system HipA family toxin [Gammaproteobacteria bacterium]